MRVATYSAPDASPAKVRVIITAEVGDPATTPAEWPIGVVITDKDDKIVFNRGGLTTLQPASAKGESPRLALTSVILLATLEFGALMLAISGLSFLGLGAQPPTSEWGTMLNNGRPFFQRAPELMLYPGLAITLTVVACNLVGDGLRDVLDPRMKR